MAFDLVWEEIFRSQAWGKYPGEELIRFVARNFYSATDRAAVRLLEVGCGPGANLWYLAREGFGFAGIDGSTTAIAQAEKRLDAECPGWRARGELRVGDIDTLPFDDATFDAVIDNEADYCNSWSDSRRIYAEMARVAKSGGRFIRGLLQPEHGATVRGKPLATMPGAAPKARWQAKASRASRH